MGQGGSGNAIFVQLDTITYNPGDTVSGVVQLQINRPVMATTVELKVTGHEWVEWEDRERVLERREGREDEWVDKITRRWDKREFFKIRIPCYALNQQVRQGQYSFPFRFRLPPTLPGSFMCGHGRGGRIGRTGNHEFDCACLYKVKAMCHVQGFLKPDIKHKQHLNIIERPPPILQAVSEATSYVRICCCFNRGSVYVKMHAEKNAYAPGELVQVIADMRNDSESTVHHVDLSVNRNITLHASGHRKYEPMCVAHQRCDIELAPKGGTLTNHPFTIQLPYDLPPMCNGYLIQCSYSLTVSASVRCAPAPSVTLPIVMYLPQPPPSCLSANWQAPQVQNWHPQTFQVTEFEVPAPSAPPPIAQAYQAQPQGQLAGQFPQPQYAQQQPVAQPGQAFAAPVPQAMAPPVQQAYAPQGQGQARDNYGQPLLQGR